MPLCHNCGGGVKMRYSHRETTPECVCGRRSLLQYYPSSQPTSSIFFWNPGKNSSPLPLARAFFLSPLLLPYSFLTVTNPYSFFSFFPRQTPQFWIYLGVPCASDFLAAADRIISRVHERLQRRLAGLQQGGFLDIPIGPPRPRKPRFPARSAGGRLARQHLCQPTSHACREVSAPALPAPSRSCPAS